MNAVRVERDGPVLRVTLARPERRNAFDAGVIVAAAGRYEQVVKISPPLTIDEGLAHEAVDVVIDAIRRSR